MLVAVLSAYSGVLTGRCLQARVGWLGGWRWPETGAGVEMAVRRAAPAIVGARPDPATGTADRAAGPTQAALTRAAPIRAAAARARMAADPTRPGAALLVRSAALAASGRAVAGTGQATVASATPAPGRAAATPAPGRAAAGQEVAAARMRVPAVAKRLATVISRDLAQARRVQAQGPHGGEVCAPGAGRQKPGARPGTARTAHPRDRSACAAAALAGAETR